MKKQILIERIEALDILTENTSNGKTLYLHGAVMKCEFENGNGRMYQRKEFEEQIPLYNETKIKNNSAWGELDHPDTEVMQLSKMSHKFVEPLIIENDNTVTGKAKILDNIWGNIVANAIEESIPLGFSSRGTGEVVNMNGKKVVCGFEIITPADIVSQPSIGIFPNVVKETQLLNLQKRIIEQIVDGEEKWKRILDTEVIDEISRNIRKEYTNEQLRKEFQRIIKENK